MLTYGLEKEMFLMDGDKPMLVPPGIPHDECGWLVEARGKPCGDICDAVHSLMADLHRIHLLVINHRGQAVGGQNIFLSDVPVMPVSKSLRHQAARRFAKGLLRQQNIYGHERHRINSTEATAGIHISFTNQRTFRLADNATSTHNLMFDFLSIFKALDKSFKEEIRNAKRNPGFYELKGDGRIEYRSLPANVDLFKVIDVVSEAVKQIV